MSGGSFNYLYNRIDNDNPLATSTLDLLEKMSEWLAEPEQNQQAASNEIRRVYSELLEINSRVYELAQNRRFLDLLKAAEWWCSNDTGIEDFESEWAKYEAQQPRALDVCPSCAGKGIKQIGVYAETCPACNGAGTRQ